MDFVNEIMAIIEDERQKCLKMIELIPTLAWNDIAWSKTVIHGWKARACQCEDIADRINTEVLGRPVEDES